MRFDDVCALLCTRKHALRSFPDYDYGWVVMSYSAIHAGDVQPRVYGPHCREWNTILSFLLPPSREQAALLCSCRCPGMRFGVDTMHLVCDYIGCTELMPVMFYRCRHCLSYRRRCVRCLFRNVCGECAYTLLWDHTTSYAVPLCGGCNVPTGRLHYDCRTDRFVHLLHRWSCRLLRT